VLAAGQLGVGEARDVAAAIYTLANGRGKQRAKRDGSAQKPREFRVPVISTGEVPIQAKITEDQVRKARGSQSVRILDIPADREKDCGVFDFPGAFADTRQLVDAIKMTATTDYGTPAQRSSERSLRQVVDGSPIGLGRRSKSSSRNTRRRMPPNRSVASRASWRHRRSWRTGDPAWDCAIHDWRGYGCGSSSS
jgi:Domain of unknown function (DUF927)